MSEYEISRRELISSTATIGAASILFPTLKLSAGDTKELKIVDTNASLFQWPFRRLPLDRTETLVNKYRELGVTEIWAGSYEALLHRDFVGVNERLAEECRQTPELIAIGEINPALPGWERDFELCVQKHNMPGVRVHPNYHGYELDAPNFLKLLKLATEAERFVQIAVAMEDARTQHPLVAVPDVDLAPLPGVLLDFPDAKIQILNWKPRGAITSQLLQHRGIFLDVARVDSTDGIAKLIREAPENRILFGTHAPFLIPEAAMIRVAESKLNEKELRSLLSGAAQSLNRKVL